MKFAAVIFDLDGTLLDTLADIGNSANDVLKTFGLPPYELSRYRTFVGDGVATLFTRALPEPQRTADRIAECVVRFSEIYDRRWNESSRPYDGIMELIAALSARGIRQTVLSNKPHAFTVKYVAEFFPNTKFECVLGQREGVPRKPDPAGVHEILAQLNLPADKVLYLGDSNVDMRTAVASATYPVGASWGFRSREELIAHGAAAVIDTPLELLSIIDGGVSPTR